MVITLWARGARDGYGGYAYDSPVSLQGRWEDKQELFLNSSQEEELSNAVIFFPEIYTPKIGDYLFNGTSIEATPVSVEGAFEIKQVLRTPDLRNVKMELKVIL